MKLRDLPDGYPVTLDTETSGLHADDDARLAALSVAYRVPNADGESDPSQPMVRIALPFDQGVNHLPLGPKDLNPKIVKRISKWPDWALNEDAGNRSIEDYLRLLKQLQRLRLILHNAKFDMQIFRAGLRGHPETGIDLEDAYFWDTQPPQRVLDPLEEVGLKPTSVRLHLGAAIGVKEGMEDDEAEALKPWLGPRTGKNADPRYDLVPWSIMGPYAGMDAALTLLLQELQWDRLFEDEHFQMVHIQRESDLMRVLYRMENRGVGFDAETGHRMARLIERERRALVPLIPFQGVTTGEPSPQAAARYFFGDPPDGLGHMKFSDKLTEKRREPQVDDEVIARLANEEWEGQDVAKMYQVHEGLKSANAKWYEAWSNMVGPDGRLRTVYQQCKVVSGRLSASRAQLQAIPQPYQMPKVDGLVGVRDLFVEDEQCPCGCGTLEMWEFDVSQAEIRIATAMAECQPMLDGFLKGLDSHTIATLLMFGNVFEREGLTGCEKEHPNFDEFRQIGKRCNLGILYGAGAKVIQEQIKKFTGLVYPLKQVSGWIEDWNAAFPQMGARLEELERRAVRVGWVKLINNRQRWFSAYEPLHKAFNQEIQGSLAEVMKDVMIDTENRFPNSLLLQIHDSEVLRLARHQVEAGAVQQMNDLMVGHFEKAFTRKWKTGEVVTVPFKSDAKRFGRKLVAA